MIKVYNRKFGFAKFEKIQMGFLKETPTNPTIFYVRLVFISSFPAPRSNDLQKCNAV